METLGKRVAQRRKELNLTQEELARKLGYASKVTVSKTENDVHIPSLENIQRYADALDCDPAYLACWQDEPRRDLEKEQARRLTIYAQKIMEMQKEINSLAESVKPYDN